MKLSSARIGRLLDVSPDRADTMLTGATPMTLGDAHRLAAAMGLMFDPPTVRPIA